MSEVNIQVQETVENVEIIAQNNVIEINITRQSGGGGGAVDSVNGQTGVVVLDADDISDASTSKKFVTTSEKTAITHANRSTLDAITEAFTTALKTAYDSAVAWISTNGANVLNHIASTSNPHNTTATQVDALQRNGSNANSDVDLGAFSLNAKSFHAKGTNGSGHLGLRHQSANPTATGQETVIFAGSDGEPRYKNDGNAIEQLASQTFVNSGLATKENTITAGATSQYYRGDKTFQTLNVEAVSGLQTALDAKISLNTWVDISLTSTIVGWSAFTTRSIEYLIVGNECTVRGQIAGTSNNATTSFTMPFNYTGNELFQTVSIPITNNGTAATAAGMARMLANTSTVLFFTNGNVGAFTPSGTKILTFYFTFKIN